MEDNRQHELGDWVGTQLTYRIRPFFAGDVTVGVESNIDIRALLTDYDVSPVPVQYLSTNHPDRSLGLIFQDEKKLSKRWKLDLGLRLDKSAYRRDFVSPRAALIYQRFGVGATSFSTAAVFATPAHFSCSTAMELPTRPIPTCARNRPTRWRSTPSGSSESG